jgi:XTP/dITP diphosphohydrolase
MQTNLQSQLLIATNNLGKVKEFRQLLENLENVILVTPKNLGLALSIEEVGSTYAENAALKANAFADASNLPSLADDSGLEVDALNGAPGLYSARYSSKPGANSADRRAFLLANLAHLPRPWTARFRAVLAATIPGEKAVKLFEGVCEGEIISEERGENGFGYDPIFFIPEKGLTMAQLSDQEKNLISHRGRAAQLALPTLQKLSARIK